MTDAELDKARASEAMKRSMNNGQWQEAALLAAQLAREGWEPHEHGSWLDMCVRLCDDSWYRIDKCECGMIQVNRGKWFDAG